MIRDFHDYDGGGEEVCDLCVAGAGAAGISLALALGGAAKRMVVLESGGLLFDEAIQDLYRGSNVGEPYFDLEATRLRFFGGSTNHWGGMCAPFDERDYRPQPWVAHSGWPIARDDLAPFYARAHEILDLGPGGYEPGDFVPEQGLLALAPERLAARLFRFSMPPTWLGAKYRGELERADGVEIWLHANLVDIELDSDGRAAAFVVQSLAGKRARVRARWFVLALGGIENARLLLSCDRQVSGGIGNQHDLVGRYFMDHLGLAAGQLLVTRPGWEQAYLRGHHPHAGGHQIQQAIAPGDQLQRSAGLLNCAAVFGKVVYRRPRSPGYGALHDITEGLREHAVPDDLLHKLWQVVTDLDGIARGLWERYDPTVYMTLESEQAPNPDSRVQLVRERDALGMRRVALDWRLSEIDRRTMRILCREIATEVGRLGVGRLQLSQWLLDDTPDWPDELTPSNHQLGTTRMAADPRHGVVDRQSRVFGCANLYVAGSSVFATGGFANPTVNVVAQTLRLAEHLRARLAEPLTAPGSPLAARR